jgi:hypothetical protein
MHSSWHLPSANESGSSFSPPAIKHCGGGAVPVDCTSLLRSWLQGLDYFDGHLRPRNIPLDATGNVKICDFGNMTRRGQEYPGATYPFYRSIPAHAGPIGEQFAIALAYSTSGLAINSIAPQGFRGEGGS